MSLITEDGTGKSDAESFCSIADADTYHANHGNPTAWSGALTADKETALRQGTDYLERQYGRRWVGDRMRWWSQRLAWPRWNVIVDGVWWPPQTLPRQLLEATAEAALRYIQDPTSLMPDIAEPGTIASESVEVGPIKTSTSYMGGKSQVKDFRVIRLLMAQITDGSTHAERS